MLVRKPAACSASADVFLAIYIWINLRVISGSLIGLKIALKSLTWITVKFWFNFVDV
jgi:hypothetical protein